MYERLPPESNTSGSLGLFGLGLPMASFRRTAMPALTLFFGAWTALPAASAEATVKDVIIGALTLPSLTIIDDNISQSAMDLAFAEYDDTAAINALEVAILRAPEIRRNPVVEGAKPIFILREVEVKNWEQGKATEITTAGLTIQAADFPEDYLEIGKVRAANITLGPLLTQLSMTPESPTTALQGASHVWDPVYDELSFLGIAYRAPVTSPEPDPALMSVEKLTFKGSDYAGTFPRQASIEMSGLKSSKPTASMPFTDSISGRIGLKWDDKAGALAIEEATLASDSLGALKLTGSLEGVTRAALQGSDVEMMAAWLGVRLVSAELTVDNRGFVEKYLAGLAGKQGKSIDAAKTEAAAIAGLTLPILLGDGPNTEAAAKEISAFFNDPKKLSVAIKGKDGSFGAIDLVAIESPAEALRKLDLTVRNVQ
jgi:hypothetical protein